MIDNFELFKRFMNFRNDDEFYFLQIYQRAKENNFLKADNKLIRDMHIYSVAELDRNREEIIRLCHANHARAYIRPNRRSAIYVALDAMTIISNLLKDNQAKASYRAYQKAAGRNYVVGEKFWIVDIDEKTPELLESVKGTINRLYGIARNTREIALEVPTMAGYHLVCPPFNSREFLNLYPEISLHKDNPLLLYFNGRG